MFGVMFGFIIKTKNYKQTRKIVKNFKDYIKEYGSYTDVTNLAPRTGALDTYKPIVDLNAEKKGLWHNIHMKRKRGEKMRKKGEKGAPTAAQMQRAKDASN